MTGNSQPEIPADEDRRGSTAGLADFAVPTILFGFCAVAGYFATTFDDAPEIIVGNAMQPKIYALFLVIAIAILSVVLIAQTRNSSTRTVKSIGGKTWLTIAMVLLFYLINMIDLFLAMAAVIFAMTIVWGEKRLWLCIALALVTPAFIFFFFDLVLSIQFPRGALTSLYYDWGG